MHFHLVPLNHITLVRGIFHKADEVCDKFSCPSTVDHIDQPVFLCNEHDVEMKSQLQDWYDPPIDINVRYSIIVNIECRSSMNKSDCSRICMSRLE